jgi:hypothetical protein
MTALRLLYHVIETSDRSADSSIRSATFQLVYSAMDSFVFINLSSKQQNVGRALMKTDFFGLYIAIVKSIPKDVRSKRQWHHSIRNVLISLCLNALIGGFRNKLETTKRVRSHHRRVHYFLFWCFDDFYTSGLLA